MLLVPPSVISRISVPAFWWQTFQWFVQFFFNPPEKPIKVYLLSLLFGSFRLAAGLS